MIYLFFLLLCVLVVAVGWVLVELVVAVEGQAHLVAAAVIIAATVWLATEVLR